MTPYLQSGRQAAQRPGAQSFADLLTPEALRRRADEVESRGRARTLAGTAAGVAGLALATGLVLVSGRALDATLDGMILANFLFAGGVVALGLAWIAFQIASDGRRLGQVAAALRRRADSASHQEDNRT